MPDENTVDIPLDFSGGPVEVDCPGCGRHHVIDPAEVERLLNARFFRCFLCHRLRMRRNLSAFVLSGGRTRGVCAGCDPESR